MKANRIRNYISYIPRTHSIRGKAVPLQAWRGPEVSRKLRSPDFVTTAQDVGKVTYSITIFNYIQLQ